MEPRPGRGLVLPSSPPPPHGSPSRSMDRISALDDEMLLQVLAHLGCVGTAAQTSLLSRRWRGLWMGLPDLTFRGLTPTMIEAAFCYLPASPYVSTLDVGLSSRHMVTSANSLLRAAVKLSPGQLIFTLQNYYMGYFDDIELPCFQGTTSIELDLKRLGVKPLPSGEFTALESLSVTGKIIGLRSLLNRCPRLRALSLSHPDMCFSSTTLPPASEFPALEKLSLSGKIVDLSHLLDSWNRLRELSVSQQDSRLLDIMLPPSGEFPMLEKLSISGNIADIGTLLNQCPRLRVLGVTFRSMALGSLEAGLTTLEDMAPSLGLVLSLIGVEIPWKDDISAARLNSLLSTVARLSPQKFIFTVNYEGCISSQFDKRVNTDLPCFARVTSMSIVMGLQNICFTPLPDGEFSSLKRLCISGLGIVDVAALVTRCPCLRVLNVTVATSKIMVHSVSLQELYVSHRDGQTECHNIDIVTPVLKKLDLDVLAARDIGLSISAPAVEKFSWHSTYTTPLALLFGSWRLQIMSIRTIERSYVDNRDATCWQQLPRFHVLWLRLSLDASNHLDAELNFAQEMEKLPVTNCSALELNFVSPCHVYGALVLQLLRMRRIRAATKKLKVFLPFVCEEKRACLRNCPCNKPKNWRSQNVFYTSLEEVEIYGFNGADHEHDFLRLIFRCSPMLKRLTMKLAQPYGGCTTKLSNIFLAHPSVNCCYSHFNSSKIFRPRVSG